MTNQQVKIDELKVRLATFMDRIEALKPEETSVDDIDQLINMLNELEERCK